MLQIICSLEHVPVGWEYKIQNSSSSWTMKKPGVVYPVQSEKVIARKPKK